MQLAEAANGLEYMHSLNMVHGDLKGVRFFNSLCAQLFTVKTRQTSSSIKAAARAWQILDSRPSPVWSTTLEPMPP